MGKFSIVDDGMWHIDVYEDRQIVWSGNKDLTHGTVYLQNSKHRLMVSYIETATLPSIQPKFQETKMQLVIDGVRKTHKTRTIMPTEMDKGISTAGITVSLNELSSSDNKKFFDLDRELQD